MGWCSTCRMVGTRLMRTLRRWRLLGGAGCEAACTSSEADSLKLTSCSTTGFARAMDAVDRAVGMNSHEDDTAGHIPEELSGPDLQYRWLADERFDLAAGSLHVQGLEGLAQELP